MNISTFLSGRAIQLLAVSLLALGAHDAVLAADNVQSARSTAGFESERGTAERRDPATLQTFESEKGSGDIQAEKQPTANAEHHDCCGYSIFSARTELFDDLDRDGFYTFLRVSLDIDTDYEHSELYLQVYIRGAIGEWSMIFDSNVFTINGNSGLDAYEVESELLSGYPTDYYDVLVEVYDAYTGELVLDYGPAEDAALSLLPMEEVLLDARTLPSIALSSGGGGGSLSILSLTFLLLLMLWRIHWRRLQFIR